MTIYSSVYFLDSYDKYEKCVSVGHLQDTAQTYNHTFKCVLGTIETWNIFEGGPYGVKYVDFAVNILLRIFFPAKFHILLFVTGVLKLKFG